MSGLPLLAVTLALSYLVGSIPFGYLVGRLRGVDVFLEGSGNIGATNVGRVLGKPFGFLVFVLDFAKGALPVAIAGWLGRTTEPNLPQDSLPVAAGLASFLGHLFPAYLRFRGGKGVATGAGVVAVLLPGPAIGAFLSWALVVLLTGYVSLASLAAALVLCTLRIGTTRQPFAESSLALTLFCIIAAGLVFLRHHANIRRLLQGRENRIKDSSTLFQVSKTIHVAALGLWFGAAVFFTLVVAPSIFATFAALAATPAADRPSWIPASFQPEQASQLAGITVAPIFPWYFLIQGICGLFVMATALKWHRAEPAISVHRLRFYILALAFGSVVLAWPLAQQVQELRLARYAADPTIAEPAKQSFALRHLASLLLNFITLALVAIGMALAAWLPHSSPGQANK